MADPSDRDGLQIDHPDAAERVSLLRAGPSDESRILRDERDRRRFLVPAHGDDDTGAQRRHRGLHPEVACLTTQDAERRLSALADRSMDGLGERVQPIACAAKRFWRGGHRRNGLTRGERTTQLGEHRTLVRRPAVQLEDEVAKANLHQAVMHHRQRRHLLGHEEDGLPLLGRGGNDVGDGLALARARRALHDEVVTGAHLLDDLGLARVGIDHVEESVRRKDGVKTIVGAEKRWLMREAVVQQAARQLMLLERVLGPRLQGQVAKHQQLREREEAELDRVPVDPPVRVFGDDRLDLCEVRAGRPSLLVRVDLGQPDAEVVLPALLQRQVRHQVFLTDAQVVGRSALIAHQFDRQEHERRLARNR